MGRPHRCAPATGSTDNATGSDDAALLHSIPVATLRSLPQAPAPSRLPASASLALVLHSTDGDATLAAAPTRRSFRSSQAASSPDHSAHRDAVWGYGRPDVCHPVGAGFAVRMEGVRSNAANVPDQIGRQLRAFEASKEKPPLCFCAAISSPSALSIKPRRTKRRRMRRRTIDCTWRNVASSSPDAG